MFFPSFRQLEKVQCSYAFEHTHKYQTFSQQIMTLTVQTHILFFFVRWCGLLLISLEGRAVDYELLWEKCSSWQDLSINISFLAFNSLVWNFHELYTFFSSSLPNPKSQIFARPERRSYSFFLLLCGGWFVFSYCVCMSLLVLPSMHTHTM